LIARAVLDSVREPPPAPASFVGLSFHDGVLLDSGRIVQLQV
jgi:hypothetical protein